MKSYTRVYARIDLDAIEHNMEMMKKNLKEGVSMISVIKTDGYGHGSVQIARMLASKEYIWGYAVATLDEAVVLRKGGITKPILVLGCIFPDQWETAVDQDVRFTVYTKEMAEGGICTHQAGHRYVETWISDPGGERGYHRGDQPSAGTCHGRHLYSLRESG